MKLVIGSRRSRLAQTQAGWVADEIRARFPKMRVEHRLLSTAGDRMLDRPLPEIGGKGLFTQALERALRDGEIDLAVHSCKDLPVASPPDLSVVAIPPRADPRDVLVPAESWPAGGDVGPSSLPPGAVVGTSSVRRRALLLRERPDCRVEPVRGNVETRLRKLREGSFAALILAAAGLQRLGLGEEREPLHRPAPLDPPWLPAPGQGALAVQGRADDLRCLEIGGAIADPVAEACVRAERALLAELGGGCQAPIGALAEARAGKLLLMSVVLTPDGSRLAMAEASGPAGDPEALGETVAALLRRRGADQILAAVRP